MAVTIEDIPREIMELIFNLLPHEDFMSCLKTSIRWKELTIEFCLKPHLKRLANLDEDLKNTIQGEAYHDADQILAIYKKYNKNRVLVITGSHANMKDRRYEAIEKFKK